MRYTGIQPQYFPRLHYFARIMSTGSFMIRDDVQFVIKHKYPDGTVDKSYQAHTPIKQSFGRFLLSVPTKHGGLRTIKNTQVSYDDDWIKKHLRTLQITHSKSPHYKKIYPQIENIISQKHKSLAKLNIATIIWGILSLLGEEKITKSKLSLAYVNNKLKKEKPFSLKEVRLASQSQAIKNLKNLSANEKIIALCREIGANEDYCGGTGVAAYVDHDLFKKNQIKITVQDWKCQTYPQLFEKAEFIPNLSIIDLLMNVGTDQARKIIKG